MKFYSLTLLIASCIFFYGCPAGSEANDTTDVSTVDDDYKTADETSIGDYSSIDVENTYDLDPDAFDKVTSMADETCLCLKPLEDLKVRLDKGEITQESYMGELQPILPSVGECMENIQTRLASEADKQTTEDAMIDVMRKKCPEVASVIFQGR